MDGLVRSFIKRNTSFHLCKQVHIVSMLSLNSLQKRKNSVDLKVDPY